MKMQRYIRIILSFILILSNLSVAFSMHFCDGRVEDIKLSKLENQVCKMEMKASCCADAKSKKHCADHEDESKDDCCYDQAYAEELQDQHTTEILKISPIIFQDFELIQLFQFCVITPILAQKQFLDFYVESNAPPIYITYRQLVFYEA